MKNVVKKINVLILNISEKAPCISLEVLAMFEAKVWDGARKQVNHNL